MGGPYRSVPARLAAAPEILALAPDADVVLARSAVNDVLARAAVDLVVSGTAEQFVVSRLTQEGVISRSAVQDVVAAAVQEVESSTPVCGGGQARLVHNVIVPQVGVDEESLNQLHRAVDRVGISPKATCGHVAHASRILDLIEELGRIRHSRNPPYRQRVAVVAGEDRERASTAGGRIGSDRGVDHSRRTTRRKDQKKSRGQQQPGGAKQETPDTLADVQ